ncbi:MULTISPECIES: histidine--tRNA ligase [Clostridium]|uniref:histidine--tRNA ligase n=1 Tax=Clostridium TaxID=1485 RepID=UPI0008264F92|nr:MULTISPECIES: histidine--tRNA ligase [Clostridium]PJI09336.1 histidine--tRNA ligase [Clostridium sp. CT7]
MSNKIKPSILPGFMELLPNEQLIFNDIASKVTGVYEQNGFLPMDTPVIEKEEILLAKSAGETEKQVYRIDNKDRKQVLRFDLTVPFSRFAAQYMGELTFPFKRYQLGKVYRGERNQKGRYREFYQCDVDIVGNGSLSIKNDAFVISMASKALKKIGLKTYKFQISNRKILTGILEGLKVQNMQEVMILIDKYDKITEEQFLSDLNELVGEDNAKIIDKVIKISGSSSEVVEGLKNIDVKNEMLDKGIEEVEEVIKYLKLFGVEDNEYAINLKIIRGLDYYTGTVFETLLTGNESYGSICSGGRYDNLAQNYTASVLPGVGMSIGMTRLFFVLKEIGFIDKYENGLNDKYLIIPIGDTFEYCSHILKKLLEKGKNAEMYFEEGKLKKKLTYANKLNIKYVILVGEDEVNNGEFDIKDMVTGEQKKLKLSSIDLEH